MPTPTYLPPPPEPELPPPPAPAQSPNKTAAPPAKPTEPTPTEDSCPTSCPPTDPAAATVPPPQCATISDQLADLLRHVQFIEQRTGQLLDKVDTLEEVQAGILTEQANRTRRLLLTQPPVDPVHALRDTRTIVAERLELPALRDSIVSARPSPTGIVITIRTVAEKLRILFRAQRRRKEAHVVLEDFNDGSAEPLEEEDEAVEEVDPNPVVALEKALAGLGQPETDEGVGTNVSEWSSVSFDVRIGGE